LQQNCDVNDVVNMAAICAMDVHMRRKRADKERAKAAPAEASRD